MKKNCKKTEVDKLKEEILSLRVSMLEMHQLIERQNDLVHALLNRLRDECEFTHKFYNFYKTYEARSFWKKLFI